jgi:hypothetical protein
MEVTAVNAPQALVDVLWRVRVAGVQEHSRNGDVIALQEPLTLTVTCPTERVVFDPIRDANPFFHVAEAVWMLGGGQGVEMPMYFNTRMREYSDDGKTFHGAYGHRWRAHFYRDQITWAIDELRHNPSTRRVVIAIWDGEVDHGNSLDLPCNTQIALRVVKGRLDMTVFNRSNDVVWGMCGANIVHMTMLQEVLAAGAGVPVGLYRVVSNNAHVYTGMGPGTALLANLRVVDYYDSQRLTTYPLVHDDETAEQVLAACKTAVAFPWQVQYKSKFLNHVYVPMRDVYRNRKNKEAYTHLFDNILAEDWRLAALEWVQRRNLSNEPN